MKPAQLVDGEERLLQRRIARDAEEVGVRGDGAHDDRVDVARLELGQRDARMARLEVGMALVVHVVQQPDDAPQLLVLAAAPRVGAHRRPRRPGSGGAGTPIATHSLRRFQASSRESCTDMAVRLAEPPTAAPEARRTPHLMEKFVIDGGVPLSRHRHPRREQERAPCRSSPPSVLTTDEVVVRNVPRIRDVEAMLARAARPRRDASSGATTTRSSICAAGVDREAHVDREHAERIRASFLLAGPLLARFGRADMPPPGGDVIGRRRLDPHLDAFRALGADLRARPRHRPRGAQRRPARRRGLHGRAVGHGDRERAAWPPR